MMRANIPSNVYYIYEFLRKRNGHISDYQLVKNFRHATSDEIFLAKCILADYQKKHNLLADRKCSTKRKKRTKFTTNQQKKKVNDS